MLQRSMIPSIQLCAIFKTFSVRDPNHTDHFGVMRVYIGWQKSCSCWTKTASIGLGGFHMEKVMIACCGKYLEETGFDTVFVENEVYGPDIVKSVMNGGHYVRGIRGMAIISEVLHTLQMNQLACQRGENVFNEANDIVKKISAMITESKSESAITEWECLNTLIKSREFEIFQTTGEKASNQLAFWNGFIDKIYPVLRDLTRSHLIQSIISTGYRYTSKIV